MQSNEYEVLRVSPQMVVLDETIKKRCQGGLVSRYPCTRTCHSYWSTGLMEAKSLSNLAFKVPPTVVKDSNAVDPATLACCKRSSSAASIFWAQNLNFKNDCGALEHVRSPTHTLNINTAMRAKIVIITDV